MSDNTPELLAIIFLLTVGTLWLGTDLAGVNSAIDRQNAVLARIADRMDKPLQLREPVHVDLDDATGMTYDALADKPGRKR